MGDGGSPPHGDTLAPNPDVQFLVVGDRAALFDARQQELFELNDTARTIWEGVVQSGSLSHAAQQLADLGATPSDAGRYVDDAVDHWLRCGWLVPSGVGAARTTPPVETLSFAILGVRFRLECFGAALPAAVKDSLGPATGAADPACQLAVVRWREQHCLFLDGHPRGLYRTDELAPGLKALLTEQLIARISSGFVTHGALLEAGDNRIFLTGEPGAGKSTLAFALHRAGFRCLSDDIVHVDQAGRMTGAPFALGLKPGAWPLFPREAGLEPLVIHRRRDGKDVKYLPHAVGEAPARPARLFVSLARSHDAEARLESLPPLACLKTLLESAYSAAGSISAAQMAGLATAFADMRCYRLHYASLEGAVALLQRLV